MEHLFTRSLQWNTYLRGRLIQLEQNQRHHCSASFTRYARENFVLASRIQKSSRRLRMRIADRFVDLFLRALCWIHVGCSFDALLASPPKVRCEPCRNVPVERTLTLNNPLIGESAVGRSTFPFSFIQRRHSRAKSTDIGMPSGRKLSVA